MKSVIIYRVDTGDIAQVVTGKSNVRKRTQNLSDNEDFVEGYVKNPKDYKVLNGELVEDPAPKMKPDVSSLRRSAFRFEADPLFFKWQRGEVTKEEYMAKVQEIRDRFPK